MSFADATLSSANAATQTSASAMRPRYGTSHRSSRRTSVIVASAPLPPRGELQREREPVGETQVAGRSQGVVQLPEVPARAEPDAPAEPAELRRLEHHPQRRAEETPRFDRRAAADGTVDRERAA